MKIHTVLKWLIARQEMQELNDRRTQLLEYDRWLNEFPIVHDVLVDMQAYFNSIGEPNIGYIHLGVTNLRTRLRQRYKK